MFSGTSVYLGFGPRTRTAWLLLVATLGALAIPARGDDWSQRALPVPDAASRDMLSQFRLMQELQRQLNQRGAGSMSQMPDGAIPDNPLLDRLREMLPPDQRDRIEQRMREYGMPMNQRPQTSTPLGESPLPQTDQPPLGEDLPPQTNPTPPAPSPNPPTTTEPRLAPSSAPRQSNQRPLNPPPPRTSPPTPRTSPPPIEDWSRSTRPLEPTRPPGSNRSPAASSGDPLGDVRRPEDEPTSPELPDSGGSAERDDSQEAALPSLSELLRQSQLAPDSIPPLEMPPHVTRNQEGNRGGERDRERAQNRREREGHRESRGEGGSIEVPDEVRQQLAERLRAGGLGETFRELVRESRSEVRESLRSTGTAATGGAAADADDGTGGAGSSEGGVQAAVDSALLKTLAGAREDLQGIVEQWREGRSRSPSREQGSSSPRTSNASGGQSSPSISSRFRDLVSMVADAPGGSPNTDAGSGSSTTTTVLSLASWIIAALAAVAGLWTYLRNRPAHVPEPANKVPVLELTRIQSRQDIVAAFERLLWTAGAPAERWWNHARAARALALSKPGHGTPIEELARLYEIARYTPRENPMTTDQLDRAQHAWETLKTC